MPDRWPKTLSILNGAPLIPLSITVMFVFRALLADLITVDDAYKIRLPERLIPPFWAEGGSLSHPFGTDPLGRDILTRMIFGARIAIVIASAALSIGGGFGTLIGLTPGFYVGKIDTILMRLTTSPWPSH